MTTSATSNIRRTAIITGASKGIGAASARDLAAHGWNVVLAARSADALTSLAAEINAEGNGRAIAAACDVSDYDAVANLVATAHDAFSQLDLLVNNAGVIDPIARLIDSDPVAWHRAAEINYLGVYNGLRAALPVMVAAGTGVVVNISSGAATGALEGWSHYCSSKAAALSLTRCAHKEVGDQGVRVVGLSPGTVATDMQVSIKTSGINPVSQLDPSVHIPAEWVAQAVRFLASDDARDLAGVDFTLKTPQERARVGLPSV